MFITRCERTAVEVRDVSNGLRVISGKTSVYTKERQAPLGKTFCRADQTRQVTGLEWRDS